MKNNCGLFRDIKRLQDIEVEYKNITECSYMYKVREKNVCQNNIKKRLMIMRVYI